MAARAPADARDAAEEGTPITVLAGLSDSADARDAAEEGTPITVLAGLSDRELLAELERRGLPATTAGAATASASTCRSPGERVDIEAETRARERALRLDCGPPGGPLIPQLVSDPKEGSRFRIQVAGAPHGLKEYTWELQEGSCAGMAADWHHEKFARLSSSWMPGAFGQKCVRVHAHHGDEVFSLLQSTSTWNLSQLRWSYRILPPGSKHNSDALFTVNRDLFGTGPLGLREQWRIFRGRAREGKELYYCTANAWGWEYHIYRSQEDQYAGHDYAAHLKKVCGTGVLSEAMMIWIPAEFDLEIRPREDAALLLSVATILDLAHQHSTAAPSV